MSNKVKNYNLNEIVDGIEEFDSYLSDEYSVLYQIVHDYEQTRSDSPIDQTIQSELEKRLDLLTYVKARFDELVSSKLNQTKF
jgi:hypothetical protein|tara:strand:- start:502 stop:750 length:249 start_codon:yes stop_codon:yes gene_type:complete